VRTVTAVSRALGATSIDSHMLLSNTFDTDHFVGAGVRGSRGVSTFGRGAALGGSAEASEGTTARASDESTGETSGLHVPPRFGWLMLDVATPVSLPICSVM